MTDLKQKAAISFTWKLLERGGNQVVALIVQIILARLLAPEDFGFLAILLAFVNVGNIFIQSGLNIALVQTKKISAEDYSTVFLISSLISIILYVAIFIAAPYVAAFYSNPLYADCLKILSLVFIISPFISTNTAYIQRNFEFKKLFYSTAWSAVLSGIISISLALFGLGIWALVLQQLSFYIVDAIALTIQTKWFPTWKFNFKKGKDLFSFGWKLLASNLLNTLYRSGSDLIIGRQFNAYDLGLVTQGKRYPEALCNMIDGAMQPVLLSLVAKIQDQKDLVKDAAKQTLTTITFFTFPIMGTAILVAQPLIVLLLGEHWIDTVPFFQMYCIIYALQPMHTTNLQAINGIGRSDRFLKLEIIKTIIGVGVLCFTAFIIQNIYAIVGGYIFTNILGIFINSRPSKRLLGFSLKEQLAAIWPNLLLSCISIAIAATCYLLPLSSIIIMFLQVFIVCLVYISGAFLAKTETMTLLLKAIKDRHSER